MRYNKKAIQVCKLLIEINQKMDDEWAIAKNYETMIDCLWRRDKEHINIAEILDICDKAVDGFAEANSLNMLLTTMESIAM